jgi:hypothetical protein
MAKQTFTTGQVLTAAQMTSLQQTAMGGGSPVQKTASYVLVAADAGTVIQMNSASSTTITVNTALFAAGDSVQIQNIGAGVCTVTAGTATVTTAGSLALSQWEGGMLYFTSASAAIFFDIVQSSGMTNPMTTSGDTIYGGASGTPTRLGIGTTGQVLTVAGGLPSWATTSSVGKVLQVVSANISTSANITTTTYTDTNITATITPTLSTSKILVIITAQYLNYQSSPTTVNYIDSKAQLLRGATVLFENQLATQLEGASYSMSVGGSGAFSYLDSPATTSATTYKLQAAKKSSGTGIYYQSPSTTTYSTITLLEIGA